VNVPFDVNRCTTYLTVPPTLTVETVPPVAMTGEELAGVEGAEGFPAPSRATTTRWWVVSVPDSGVRSTVRALPAAVVWV
jgi:hypothetical protein